MFEVIRLIFFCFITVIVFRICLDLISIIIDKICGVKNPITVKVIKCGEDLVKISVTDENGREYETKMSYKDLLAADDEDGEDFIEKLLQQHKKAYISSNLNRGR